MNKRYKYQEVAEQIKMDIFVNYQAPSKLIPSDAEFVQLIIKGEKYFGQDGSRHIPQSTLAEIL